MTRSIKIAKTIVSKEAVLLACIDCRVTYTIEETETHWILSPYSDEPIELEDIYRICLEKEALLMLDHSFSPLRKTLYEKAFEPIRSRK